MWGWGLGWGLKPESESLLHLDSLRFIAATGIIFLHLSSKIYLGPGAKPPDLKALSIFVDLFFAISGYVISFVYFDRIKDAKSYASYLRNRFARLIPLHWATLIFFIAIGLAASSWGAAINNSEIFDARCIAPNALLLHATGLCKHLSFNGPSWSISAEFCMYLATPLWFWVARRNWFALLLFSISSAIALSIWIGGDGWLGWTASGGAIRAIPSYCFGISLFSLRRKLHWRSGAAGMKVALLAFLTGAFFAVSWLALVSLLYIALICGVCADRSGMKPSQLLKAAAAGGQLTYSSYMLHDAVFLIVITAFGEHYLHLQGGAMNALLAAAFVLVWIASWLSLVLFEKPIRAIIAGRKESRHSADINSLSTSRM